VKGDYLFYPHWKELVGDSADSVLSKLGIYRPPVNPFLIADAMSISIRFEPLPTNIGAWTDSRLDFPTIVVNSSEILIRSRFRVAHILGHLLLHHPGKWIEEIPSPENDPIELVANNFAAELLMPITMLIEHYKVENIQILADLFGVSFGAMNLRLKNVFQQ